VHPFLLSQILKSSWRPAHISDRRELNWTSSKRVQNCELSFSWAQFSFSRGDVNGLGLKSNTTEMVLSKTVKGLIRKCLNFRASTVLRKYLTNSWEFVRNGKPHWGPKCLNTDYIQLIFSLWSPIKRRQKTINLYFTHVSVFYCTHFVCLFGWEISLQMVTGLASAVRARGFTLNSPQAHELRLKIRN